MSENEHATGDDDFVVFPIHNVVAAFHDVDSMNLVVNKLKEKGFAPDDMRTFVGKEGMQQLDFDGSAHGSAAELLRSLQHVGPDRTYLVRYEKYMREGDCILMVRAPQKERKQIASDIMREHSPYRVTYFGTLVIEEV